jgi:hypothetical protein
MKAYQAVALDVIQITHPRYTWVNENFEVLSSRFVWDKSGSTPTIAVELDLAQTESRRRLQARRDKHPARRVPLYRETGSCMDA